MLIELRILLGFLEENISLVFTILLEYGKGLGGKVTLTINARGKFRRLGDMGKTLCVIIIFLCL